MDIIVVILALCFIIGIISSTLLVTLLYLCRESRRISAIAEGQVPSTPDIALMKREKAISKALVASSSARSLEKKKLKAKEDCQVVATSPVMQNQGDCDFPDGMRILSRSNSLDNCSNSSSCSYMRDACGSCCQEENEPDELKPSKGDHTLLCPPPPPYPCGEFFVSGVDVGFKCQASGSAKNDATDGVGGGSDRDGGAFFFYRGRQLGELMEPIDPSDQYLIIAALPSVPYHLWFCPSVHQNKSHRCPECRQIFCFELCDSEIRFQPIDDGSRKCSVREVWILACEEAAGSHRVIYRGDAGSLISLHYSGKLFVYFGFPEHVVVDASASASSSRRRQHVAEFVSATVSLDKDQATENDLINQLFYLKHRRQHQRRRRGRQRNVSGGRGCSGESRRIDRNICPMSDNNNEPDANTLNTESIHIDQPPSPLSMDSMRKAVKWPITQIENLIESSSDDRLTKASDENPARTEINPSQFGTQFEIAAENEEK